MRASSSTLSARDFALDPLPLFEARDHIEAWLDAFHEHFNTLAKRYPL